MIRPEADARRARVDVGYLCCLSKERLLDRNEAFVTAHLPLLWPLFEAKMCPFFKAHNRFSLSQMIKFSFQILKHECAMEMRLYSWYSLILQTSSDSICQFALCSRGSFPTNRMTAWHTPGLPDPISVASIGPVSECPGFVPLLHVLLFSISSLNFAKCECALYSTGNKTILGILQCVTTTKKHPVDVSNVRKEEQTACFRQALFTIFHTPTMYIFKLRSSDSP